VARWGGEEFVVLCPTTKLAEARGLAERIRQAIERLEGTDESGNPLPPITIEQGVQATDLPGRLLSATDFAYDAAGRMTALTRYADLAGGTGGLATSVFDRSEH